MSVTKSCKRAGLLKNRKCAKTLVISRGELRKAMGKDFNRFMIQSMSLVALAGPQPLPTENVEEFIEKVLSRLGRKECE